MNTRNSKDSSSALAATRRTGRPVFGANGTSWEWQTATGVFEREISSEQMNALLARSVDNLQLMEEPVDRVSSMVYRSHQRTEAGSAPTRVRAPVRKKEATLFSRLRQALGA